MEPINRSPLLKMVRGIDWTVVGVFTLSALFLLVGWLLGGTFGLWDQIDPGFVVCLDGPCPLESAAESSSPSVCSQSADYCRSRVRSSYYFTASSNDLDP